MNRPAPPSGATPPAEVFTSDGNTIDLRLLASDICSRYRTEFPDEEDRYGPAGTQWCLHDNQYLLAWAIQDARDGTVLLSEQAVWLANVLKSRNFPIARLARDLEIASEVTRASLPPGALAAATADALSAAAEIVAGLARAGVED